MGKTVEPVWDAREGYHIEIDGDPALTLDPAGDVVAVQVFESADLPAHWARLDAFEGSDYRRVVVPVMTARGVVEASIYDLSMRKIVCISNREYGICLPNPLIGILM